ncbi:MAG: prepilin-type N-terminal cleavage/methylation domain-containing protein [Candidatus Sumerlaeota bacterium]|nr:prepilin-type N-terminal cleavage/methylation domain-containing protein [Candidatus Sumerlaeota bacterium]
MSLLTQSARTERRTPEASGGVTMIELLVVLAIIAILATIAVGQYESAVIRAKITGAYAEIRQIELACERYRLDLGDYPPSSSSGTWVVGAAALAQNPTDSNSGCGFMTLVLQHSLSGDATHPIDPRWKGPYLKLDREQYGDLQGRKVTVATPLAMIQILDPWGLPYRYLNHNDYLPIAGNPATGGTQLPVTDPFFATERFFNINTIQIVSKGPNGITLVPPQYGLDTEGDDITNFTRSGKF